MIIFFFGGVGGGGGRGHVRKRRRDVLIQTNAVPIASRQVTLALQNERRVYRGDLHYTTSARRFGTVFWICRSIIL